MGDSQRAVVLASALVKVARLACAATIHQVSRAGTAALRRRPLAGASLEHVERVSRADAARDARAAARVELGACLPSATGRLAWSGATLGLGIPRRAVAVRLFVHAPSGHRGDGDPPALSESLTVADMPDRIGHYRIVRQIGRGGMGIVYEAIDERLQRPVAIKAILPASDPQMRDRLMREARTAAAVSHPHICQTLRDRRARRRAVSGDGAARGPVAGGSPGRRAAAAGRSDRDGDRGAVGARRAAPAVDRAPRPQAVERVPLARTASSCSTSASRGLSTRSVLDDDGADAAGHAARHAAVHGARAGARRRRGRAHRPLCGRRASCSRC